MPPRRIILSALTTGILLDARRQSPVSGEERSRVMAQASAEKEVRAEQRAYRDDQIRHPPAEASNGRAATRRRAQVAAAQAKRDRQL